MEWVPLSRRIKYLKPDEKKKYKNDIQDVIDTIAPPGSTLHASARGSHKALEHIVLSAILKEVREGQKTAGGKRAPLDEGVKALNLKYPGITNKINDIFNNHRKTTWSRFFYAHRAEILNPINLGRLNVDTIRKANQNYIAGKPGGRAATDAEKKYIDDIENPGFPEDNRQQWVAVGNPRDIIAGPDLALDYNEVLVKDPINRNRISQMPTQTLDHRGGVKNEDFFPPSANAYLVDLAREKRAAFERAFSNSNAFGPFLKLGSKLTEWGEYNRFRPGKHRKALDPSIQNDTGLDWLYSGNKESKARVGAIFTQMMKNEFAPNNAKIAKYWRDHPNAPKNGIHIAKALGINYNACLDNREFSGLKALLLSKKLDPNSSDPATKQKVGEYLDHLTNDYYIKFGFREFRNPIKSETGAAQFGTEQQGEVVFNDVGFRPKHEAAKAAMMDFLEKAGEMMFTGKSFIDDLGTTYTMIPGPDGKPRMKAVFEDGRTKLYDPDDYWDIQARTMDVGEAAMMHQQIQQLARDPINYAVAWYYQGLGNMIMNSIPGARAAQNTALGILKNRNKLLPKNEQLSVKALKQWSNILIKRTVLSPMYVYDPVTKRAFPRYAYIVRKSINYGLDMIAGNDKQPGVLDKILLKNGLLGKYEWFWNSDANDGDGGLEKRKWEPRVFKNLTRKKRQEKRLTIFDIALRLGTGIVYNMVVSRAIGIISRVPMIAKGIYGIQQLRTLPYRVFNKTIWSKISITGAEETIISKNASYVTTLDPALQPFLDKTFFGQKIYQQGSVTKDYQTYQSATLRQGFLPKLYKALTDIFSKNGINTTGRVVKIGWKMGGAAFQSVVQAAIPAALAGIVFNSPIAFAGAFITAGVPALFMNIAQRVHTDPKLYTETFKSFDSFKTLGDILYTTEHSEAAKILGPRLFEQPKLFGLERFIYDKIPAQLLAGSKPGVLGAPTQSELDAMTEWRLKDTRFAKFFSNHANVRGLMKGLGRSTFAASIVYALTGSYAWAAAAVVGTISGSIVLENVSSAVSQYLARNIAMFDALKNIGGGLSSITGGSLTMTMGAKFMLDMASAAFKGGDEWKEWSQTNFGGAMSTSISLMTVIGSIGGLSSLGAAGTQLGAGLLHFVSETVFRRLINLGITSGFGTYAKIGGVIGMVIGAVIGGIMGAQFGAMLGGSILGAVGGIFGAVAFGIQFGAMIGTFTAPIIGSIVGGIVGGLLGAIGGGLIERFIRPRLQGLINNFKAGFNIVGNALNILQAVKLLLSGNLADVGVGALMLCLAGVFTFSTLTTNSMTAASHVETEWTESGISGPIGTAAVPITIKDFAKTTNGFSEDETTIIYKIHVTNTDDENRNITIHFEDVLNAKDSSMQSTISYEILEGDNVSENRSGKTIHLEQGEKTLSVNEENTLEIKFKINSRTFPDWIAEMQDEKMCNIGKIVGQIDGGGSVDYTDIICIDKDGNITGPGGKCPVSTTYKMVQACHPTSALDLSLAGGNEVFSTVNGKIGNIRSPEDITNEGYLSQTGCFDGGFAIDIDSDNGVRHGFWHIQFDNNSFNHFSVNGKELKVGDRVQEGQLIGWIWDGAVGSPTLDTCYQNPGGRTGLYQGKGVASGTWWTGPHLHFAIYSGTPPCKAVINFVDDNCPPATNTWDHSYNY